MLIYSAIATLLTASYAAIFFFYLSGWLSIPEFANDGSRPKTKVSIIIPIRNEEANIESLLRDLLKQKFPVELLEVIVVDDYSEDGSAEIVSSFQNKNLRLLQLKDFIHEDENISSYKKKALEVGIANANGELIITTDGDCKMNNEWLTTIVNFYERKKCSMIVAPVLMTDEGNFFSRFQSLDCIGMIGITGATLQLNFPTMCNGANLAFSKKAFDMVNGYEGISATSSGDDLLLMHKMARYFKRGVKFLKNNEAAVYTRACASVPAFINQRMRWTSKSKVYDDWRIKINLLLVLLFNLSVLISAGFTIFDHRFLLLLIVQLSSKLILDFCFLSQVAIYFSRKKLLWLFLYAEIIHIFYIALVGVAGNFVTVKWKGRTIK